MTGSGSRVLADMGVPLVVGVFGAVGILLIIIVIKWQHQSNMCFEFEKRPRNLPTHKLIKKNSPAKIPLQSTEDITYATSTIDIDLEKQRVMFAYICQGG